MDTTERETDRVEKKKKKGKYLCIVFPLEKRKKKMLLFLYFIHFVMTAISAIYYYYYYFFYSVSSSRCINVRRWHDGCLNKKTIRNP